VRDGGEGSGEGLSWVNVTGKCDRTTANTYSSTLRTRHHPSSLIITHYPSLLTLAIASVVCRRPACATAVTSVLPLPVADCGGDCGSDDGSGGGSCCNCDGDNGCGCDGDCDCGCICSVGGSECRGLGGGNKRCSESPAVCSPSCATSSDPMCDCDCGGGCGGVEWSAVKPSSLYIPVPSPSNCIAPTSRPASLPPPPSPPSA
jgi:hypothetical protein